MVNNIAVISWWSFL